MPKAAFLTLWIAVVAAASAAGHAQLASSVPADGSVLETAPGEIRLWFDEDISPAFSSAQLLDINAKRVDFAGIFADPDDPKLLVLKLDGLADGVYSVLARTLSEADGHTSSSFIVFGVGSDVDLGSAVAAVTEEPPSAVEVVLRWLKYATLMALIGGVAVLQLFLPWNQTAKRNGTRDAHTRVIRWLPHAAAAGLVIGAGSLAWQTYDLSATVPEGVSTFAVVAQVIGYTRWGMLWLTGMALIAALSGLLYQWRRQVLRTASIAIWLPISASAVLVGLAVTYALGGHAAAVWPGKLLAIVNDALHIVAAGVWVGGFSVLAFGLLPLMRRDTIASYAVIRSCWSGFGRFAAVAVGLLFATGLYSMARQVASLDALVTTLYGQTLMTKVLFVLGAGVFGALNAMLFHPVLARPLAWLLGRPAGWTPLSLPQFLSSIRWEASLGAVVVLVTAMLTATAAPRGPEHMIDADEIPAELSQRVADLVMTLSVKPNRPGQNVFTVFTGSSQKPAPAQVMRVILRLRYLDHALGRVSVVASEVEPGRYLVGGNFLSLAGRWQIEVVVRRKGIHDAVANFDWIVAPPGKSRPELLSKRPISTLLTLSAAVVTAIVSLLVGLLWPSRRHTESSLVGNGG